MASLNKVMLIGNLTRDPEVKYTPRGTAVADVGLAVNRLFTADDGERREETTFVDIILWGRIAEIAKQYCKKGSPLFVEGRLQLDTWDDKQTGQKRSRLRVVAENIQLLGSRPSAPTSDTSVHEPSKPQERSPSASSSYPTAKTEPPVEDDDIPF